MCIMLLSVVCCYNRKRTEFLSCTHNAIETFCQKAAADVYVEVIKKINEDPCSGAAGKIPFYSRLVVIGQ